METYTLDLVISVQNNVGYLPITGIDNPEEEIAGWEWDRKNIEGLTRDFMAYQTTIGGHTIGLRDGIKKDYWQSSTLQDCGYSDLTSFSIYDYTTWTPYVSSGIYTYLFDQRNLYGDFSWTGRFDKDTLTESLMALDLRDDCIHTNMQIAIWKRTADNKIIKHRDFKYVESFTGKFSAGVRLDCGEPGTFAVNNMSDRHYEYYIDSTTNKVYLNGVHYVDKTFTPSNDFLIPPADEASLLLDNYGLSSGNGRDVYLNYLPIQADSVKVWIKDGLTLSALTEVADPTLAEPTDEIFYVDYDLGIVTLGGYQAPDLVLQSTINSLEEDILVYPQVADIDSYPDKGVIIIGTEEIYYGEKHSYGFSNCIRGYNGTTATTHVAADTITHRKIGTTPSGFVYVEYIAVPRIDYEVQEAMRTCNGSRWLDVRPVVNVRSNSILQILPGEINLSELILATDSPLIGSNLYGPLYYGSDTSVLTLQALDNSGNPVSEIPLTISILNGEGLLNGTSTSYTEYSNSEGQTYTYFGVPFDEQGLQETVTGTSQASGNTTMLVPEITSDVSVDDIYVFQILKHDKYYGTTGLPLEVLDEGTATEPYGQYWLDVDGLLNHETYYNGQIKITISSIVHYRTITYLEDLLTVDDQPYTRIYLSATLASATGVTAYLFEKDVPEWDPILLNGVKHILYEYRSDIEHPLTGELGAYYPVHPSSVSDGSIVFNSRLLPIPAPTDPDNNLGGYIVMYPKTISLQASGQDPISGRMVTSNIIRLRVQLPPTLIGVDTTGASPVPTGFKFAVEEFNIAGGLGGANFISINNISSIFSMNMLIDI